MAAPFVSHTMISSALLEKEYSYGPDGARDRVHTLDYLRGILALGVMLYHWKYINNIQGGWLLNRAMEKIGPYSVCAFFVLSGMSLGLVYAKRKVDPEFLLEFMVKRIFRIVPLYWLAVTLTLLLEAWENHSSAQLPGFERLLLNYSLLFGWISPTSYIPMGGWSIGDEMVFYSLFPGILLLTRKSLLVSTVIAIFVLILGTSFAFFLMDSAMGWSVQWGLYVNPLNHLFLFAFGVIIAVWRPALPISQKWHLSALLLCIAALLLIPANESMLFTGWGRMGFSGMVILIAWIVLEWKKGVGRFAPLLSWIGWISYGVYLLHPIFIRASLLFVAYPLRRNPMIISLAVGGTATLIAATISWICFEKPMMRLGRRLLPKRNAFSS